MSATLLAISSTFAQRLATPNYHQKETQVLAKKAGEMQATASPEKMADMREAKAISSRHMAPRRTQENGVWYQRPDGSFYVSGYSGTNYWSYIYMPAFADMTFKNMATDREAAKWAYIYQGEADPLEGDENNDLVQHIAKVPTDYISSYWIPRLSVGRTSYTFGENFPNNPDVALINGDTVMTITDVNLSNGYYYGFSNGGSFGTRTGKRVIDGEEVDIVRDALYEFYDKPAKPLYLTDLWFRVVNYEGTPLMNYGTEMKVTIRKIQDGVISDVIAEMPFTLDDALYIEEEAGKTFGAFQVSQKEVDAFGTEYEVPILIEDEFVIIISGFEQEDVNFTLYMTGDIKEIDTDSYLNGGKVFPTCGSYVRADTGEPIDGLYPCQTITKEESDRYNEEDGDNIDWTRHYNAVIHLDAMTDVVSVYDGFEQMYAYEEGGPIFAVFIEENEETGENEFVAYSTVQYESTLPRISTWEGFEGEENYEFVDLPDWLTVSEYNDDYYEDYYVTLAQLIADPLPEGVAGRKAEIRIVSERGADSGIITVTQGIVVDPDEVLKELAELVEEAEKLQEEVDNDVVKAALADAIAGSDIDDPSDIDKVDAAIDALNNAIDLAQANIIAQEILPAMKKLIDATNVYTEEALNTYYTQWNDKYVAGTLTKEEADGLQNPEIATEPKAAVTVDDFLLSAWDTKPDFLGAPYYINTWGADADFSVPFFEYATAENESLAERTLTATMDGQENGEYQVEALTGVSTKKGSSEPAYGITLQVNDGTPVDITSSDKAVGNVTDGTVKIKFNVAADNNINWLAFKNVKFTRLGDINGIYTINGDVKSDVIYNLNGQKVEKAQKGLYIINGKKVQVK